MVDLRFEDPPDPVGRVVRIDPWDMVKNRDRDARIEALRSHPGRWAVVSTHLSRPSAAKVARILRVRYPDVEFRTVGTPDGGVVYGRHG